MSSFFCRNGHEIGTLNRCRLCGESVYEMDGLTELANEKIRLNELMKKIIKHREEKLDGTRNDTKTDE
jgi:hypothetical protein